MKKKILATIIAVLVLCLPLTACGESFKNPPVEGKQDTSYVVLSNGGSAVQYGNYVYYINGYRGYDDEDGSDNYWSNVVKGGLYRAELKGSDTEYVYMTGFGTYMNALGEMKASADDVKTNGLKSFKSKFDIDPEYDFETEPTDFVTKRVEVPTGYEKDENGKIVYDDNNKPVESEPDIVALPVSYKIAGKTIGTSGYDKGGIFIFDEYVYYATPSRHQDREGVIEVGRTEFYRTKLDGTGTVLLYTSTNETYNSEYAFYKQNDKVYLTVHDGDKIVSVTIGNKKTESVKEIAEDVTSVLFPTREVYFNGIDTNQVEDFIYYTRDINENDDQRTGNVAFVMRPDGSECIRILETGNTVTLVGVDNGYFFYEEARTVGDVIIYTNLHEQLMAGSESYKKAYEKNKSVIETANGGSKSPLLGHHEGEAFNREEISDFSTVICFRPDTRSNQVYTLCSNGSGMYIYNNVNKELEQIYGGSVDKIFTIQGNNVYFGDGDGNYYYTNVYNKAEDNSVVTIASGMNTTATFRFDIMGDLVMMFGEVDDYASDYAMFVNIAHIDDGARFVGERSEEDTYDPSVELNQTEETDE